MTLIKDDEIGMIGEQLRLEPDQIVFHAVPGDSGIDDLDSIVCGFVEYSLESRWPRRGVGRDFGVEGRGAPDGDDPCRAGGFISGHPTRTTKPLRIGVHPAVVVVRANECLTERYLPVI